MRKYLINKRKSLLSFIDVRFATTLPTTRAAAATNIERDGAKTELPSSTRCRKTYDKNVSKNTDVFPPSPRYTNDYINNRNARNVRSYEPGKYLCRKFASKYRTSFSHPALHPRSQRLTVALEFYVRSETTLAFPFQSLLPPGKKKLIAIAIVKVDDNCNTC